jgi:hypothetical protein
MTRPSRSTHSLRHNGECVLDEKSLFSSLVGSSMSMVFLKCGQLDRVKTTKAKSRAGHANPWPNKLTYR